MLSHEKKGKSSIIQIFVVAKSQKIHHDENLSHKKYTLNGASNTNATLKSTIGSEMLPWNARNNTKEELKFAEKGHYDESPLTEWKTNELNAVTLDFLLRMMSLKKGEIDQIIGRKCELVNGDTCVSLFARFSTTSKTDYPY